MDNFSKSNSSRMSDDIRQFGAAFLLAKENFRPTGKSAYNAQFKGNYAKIDDIYNAVESALKKQNIVIWHMRDVLIDSQDKTEVLYTRLTHVLSGQYIEDVAFVFTEKPGNQGRGAANTYTKKQAVLNLCAISTEEYDDDGQAEQKYIEEKSTEYINAAQIKELEDDIKSSSDPKKLWFGIKAFNRIEDLSELNVLQFKGIKSYIAKNK